MESNILQTFNHKSFDFKLITYLVFEVIQFITTLTLV